MRTASCTMAEPFFDNVARYSALFNGNTFNCAARIYTCASFFFLEHLLQTQTLTHTDTHTNTGHAQHSQEQVLAPT